MINIQDVIKRRGFKTRMIIQVHDELVFDLYRAEREEIIPLIKEKMETAIPMRVPIMVEIGLGKNWLEAH